MTPFGERLRALRAARGITLAQMAADLGVSAAYLSAVEHGRRSRPTPGFVRMICAYFGIIWDEADALAELAEQSRPRVVVDTAGLSPRATKFANLVARRIRDLPEAALDELIARLQAGDER